MLINLKIGNAGQVLNAVELEMGQHGIADITLGLIASIDYLGGGGNGAENADEETH